MLKDNAETPFELSGQHAAPGRNVGMILFRGINFTTAALKAHTSWTNPEDGLVQHKGWRHGMASDPVSVCHALVGCLTGRPSVEFRI